MGKIESLLRKLRRSKSGNATMLLALGMPMLIGGTGLAVDTAQWYLWKRELQFAVDQSAIAAAWARAEAPTGNMYVTRGEQEYEANLALVADFDSGPTITLEDYDGGTDNSVQVIASATNLLPFSSFLTGQGVTVSARAQTIFEPGQAFNPCLLALDPSAPAAVKFNGNVGVTATCGVGSLSTDPTSVIKVGGAGNIDVNYVITAGEIDDPHGHFDEEYKLENAHGLSDPYEDLTPPDNPTPRSLSCGSSSSAGVYTADETVLIETSFTYFQGKNKNNLTAINYSPPRETETSSSFTDDKEFGFEPFNTTVVDDPVIYQIAGGGNNKIWEAATTTTRKTYADIQAPSGGGGSNLPGTYSDFTVNCDTVLSSGIYVIDGGSLEVKGNTSLSGSGVMFVLKNGADIQIAGTSDINLSAMNEQQLIAAGVDPAVAPDLVGMLIFEDPNSPGTSGSKITGNTNAILDGIIYLPNSDLKIAGTPQGSSECLVLAAKTLDIFGTADLTTLCPVGATPTGFVSESKDRVLLVG